MPLVVPDTDQTPDLLEIELDTLRTRAADLAEREHGLRAPLEVSEPVREEFPGGHMFAVAVRERDGKRRTGTARFDRAGRPVMWNLEGNGAGTPEGMSE